MDKSKDNLSTHNNTKESRFITVVNNIFDYSMMTLFFVVLIAIAYALFIR